MVKVTTEMYVNGWFDNRCDVYIERYYGDIDESLETYLRESILEEMDRLQRFGNTSEEQDSNSARLARRIVLDLVQLIRNERGMEVDQ